MSAETFKAWMLKQNLSIIDVASQAKLSVNTVRNFLDGKRVHRSTRSVLEGLVRPSGQRKVAQAG